MANNRTCVDPSNVDCSVACYSGSGSIHISLGRCTCSSYTDPDQICNATCRAYTQPTVSLELKADGTVSLTIYDPVTGSSTVTTMSDIVGPSETTTGSTQAVVVNFYEDVITASVYATAADAASEVTASLSSQTATVVTGRRRLLATTVPTNQVANPAICIEQNQMVVFKVSINATDRSYSNYPVYVTNHLYNTNPTFDYGPFTHLAYLIANTNVSITFFAHVFTDGGTYVFQDAQDASRDVIIEVKPSGSTCPSSSSSVTSSSPSNLALFGVYKQSVSNEEPDWGLIIGLLAFFGACVVLLVVAVVVWRPRDSIIYPMKRWKPRYRSLGIPPPVPSYIRYDVDHWPDKISDPDLLGPRPDTLGSDTNVMAAVGKNEPQELENFNVRVFYDKLEDQNLHLAAQLARQKEDLDNFYSRICAQNDELRNLLNNMDPAKLEALERRGEAIERMTLVGAAAAANGSLPGNAAGKFKYASAGTREAELMAALKLLLDRLNTGTIPMSTESWEQLQRGAPAGGQQSSLNIFRTGGGAGGKQTTAQGELLRQQNGEKMQLERELARSEQDAFDSALTDLDSARRKDVDTMMDALAFKLQGDLKDSEVQEILHRHEKDLQGTLNKHNAARERQMEELRRRLAEKRKQREALLREKHKAQAEKAGLPPPPEGSEDTTDMTLKTEEGLLNVVHSEDLAGQAKGEMDANHNSANQQRKQMSTNLTSQIEALGGQSLIPEDLTRELLKQQKNGERDLANQMDARRRRQEDELSKKLAQRRQARLRKKQGEMDQETADLSAKLIQEGRDSELDSMLHSLTVQHQQQRLAVNTELDADDAEQRRQLSQGLDDDYTLHLSDIHRDIKKELEVGIPEKGRLAAQRLMDQYRRELDAQNHDRESEKNRQLADLESKLSAKKQRRLNEAARLMEEEAARRFVAEQTRQLAQDGGSDSESVPSDLQHKPTVTYAQSSEEPAMLREQERQKEELTKRHKQEREKLAEQLDQDAQRQEAELKRQADAEMEQALREKKNRNAAEEAARTDLTQEQLAELMARHRQEVEDLADKMESEKSRQLLALRDRLAENRRRRMADLRRKQDAELTNELLEQRKELNEVRLREAKKVEKVAIEEGIRENGVEDSDKVVQAVLAARHAQELRDLEAAYQAKRRVMLDEALNKLHADFDKQRDKMMQQHHEELAKLQKMALSPEELAERRAALLNRQEMELADLERRLAEDEGHVRHSAAADWEVAFARDKLALKERHYKEFADALREYSPKHEGVESAEEAADELEKVQAELEQRRREKEQQLTKEQEEFEKSEEKRVAAEMSSFARDLEQETEREKEKFERNVEALNKRKEELVEENKKKLQAEMERLKASGASQEEQDQLLKQHEREVSTLVSKLEADRLRMHSNVQDRLKRRRADKLQQKEAELKEEAAQHHRQMDEHQRSEQDRLKMDEMVTLQEALNVDRLAHHHDGVGVRAPAPSIDSDSHQTSSAADTGADAAMPTSFARAAPLDEAELMALLMASPLYQKLEKVKNAVASGALQGQSQLAPGEGHLDERDAQWTADKDLNPLDVNSLNARSFVIYKFGCYIAGMVAARCRHAPVTILLADRVPANPQLSRNMYRNSFHFDANNRILYVRAARLDTVGEFVLVLVHCLAHVKSGDLRDDTSPKFTSEYQRALTVVCDSLFFSQHNRSSVTTQAVADAMGTDANSAGQALQKMLGESPGEDARTRVLEDLLDVKILPEVDSHGRQFNADRVQERLSKYSNFSMSSKLQDMLGDLEVKVHQSGAQGSGQEVAQQLASLSQRYSTAGTTVLTRQPPPSFSMANMSGHALWQTFSNQLRDDDDDSNTDNTAAATAGPPETTPQDEYDDLCQDFARICQQQVAARDTIRQLEQDVTFQMELVERSKGSEREMHARQQQEVTQQLNAARESMQKLMSERARIEKLLEKSVVSSVAKPEQPAQESAAKPSQSGKVSSQTSGRKTGKSKK